MSNRQTAVAASVRVAVELLESRRLLATRSVAEWVRSPTTALMTGPRSRKHHSALIPATPSSFPRGVYDVNATLTFRDGRTYDGLGGATLDFNIGSRLYGGVFFKDSSNITVKGLKFDGGGMSLSAGSKYTNINIINNEITNTAGTAGIFASIPSDGLIVEGNKIHSFRGSGAICGT